MKADPTLTIPGSTHHQPAVSVVIPCFNQAQYLPDAVRSVLDQSYRDFEIIIVDDGSTDDTKQVAQALISGHPQQSMRLVSHANQGLAASRNEGIRASRGVYILPLDSDDKIKPEFLQVCIERLTRESPASIVAVNLEEFGDSDRKLSCGNPILECIAIDNQINYCSIFLKSLWERVRGYRSSMRWGYEDWDFWISCVEKGARIEVVADHLFLYRKRGDSMYSSALEHDAELRARIAMGHPTLYDNSTVTWATALLQVRDNPEDMDAHHIVAEYYAARGRWHEAIPHLMKLMDQPVLSGDLVFLSGVAKLRTKQFAEAKTFLRRYLDEHPDHAVGHFLSAIACACLGDLISAREHCEDAVESDLRMPEALELLIAICSAQQDTGSVNDLVSRSRELQIQLAPSICSDQVIGQENLDWAEHLWSRYLRPVPLALLQLKSSSDSRPAAQTVRHAGQSETNAMVSVIIPTYNRPETLLEAIESVLKQTYQHFEILVINDAGIDVEAIVEKMNAAGKIKYVRHSRNQGLSAARNTGIKLARGKYIAYLDDDDLFYPDHLHTLLDCLKHNDCAVAYTDAYQAHQVQRDGRTIVTHRDLQYSCDFDHDLILVRNFIPVLCVMHQRDCLDDVGLFDESLTTHEDWDLWIRLSRRYRFGHIKKATCEYSRLPGASMSSCKEADFLRTLEIIYQKGRKYSTGKPHVLEAQRKLLLERRNALKASQSRSVEPTAAGSDLHPVLARVQRYISMGKREMAARIIQKELGHLTLGPGGSELQEQLVLVLTMLQSPSLPNSPS